MLCPLEKTGQSHYSVRLLKKQGSWKNGYSPTTVIDNNWMWVLNLVLLMVIWRECKKTIILPDLCGDYVILRRVGGPTHETPTDLSVILGTIRLDRWIAWRSKITRWKTSNQSSDVTDLREQLWIQTFIALSKLLLQDIDHYGGLTQSSRELTALQLVAQPENGKRVKVFEH